MTSSSDTGSLSQRHLAWACACLFLSGAVALLYEICWIRKASFVFGGSSLALSTVLASFFAGLALGSEVFGRRSRRVAHPLALYGSLEIALGVVALLATAGFELLGGVWGTLHGALIDDPQLLSLARIPFVALLVMPPAVLMGGSLPLFCREFVRERSGMSLGVGGLYALNTLGATVGCVLTGWWLIPTLGLRMTLGLGALISIALGCMARRLAAGRPALAEVPEDSGAALTDRPFSNSRWVLLGLIFLTGFVGLGNEVVWARFVSLIVRNTVHTYTLTLAVVLTGIVIGSLLASRFADRWQRRGWFFGWLSVLGGLTVVGLLRAPPSLWRGLASDGGQVLFVGALMLLPAILMGATFPVAVRLAVDRPESVGLGVGRVAAASTSGGILGSLVVGFVVLPTWGLSSAVQLVAGIGICTGVGAWWWLDRSTKPVVKLVATALSLGAWVALPSLSETRLPADYLADRDELIAFREGGDAPIAVLDRGGRKVLEIDRLWQGEDHKNHQIVAAHLPMILHPDPQRVLVIGVGAGQTPARFLMHDIERLTCVDIQPGLFDVLGEHFESDWMDDERVMLREADGRGVLAHGAGDWDLVSIEVGQTFRSGVASFYTADFYRLAADKLAPGGLVSQFVPIAFLTEAELRSMVATFLSVFPHSALFFNTTELLLVGRADSPLTASSARLADVLQNNAAVRDDLAYAYWGGESYHLNRPEALVGCLLMGEQGLAQLATGGQIQIDDLPSLEYSAADRAAGTVHGSEEALSALLLELVDDDVGLFEPAFAAPLQRQAAEIRRAYLRDVPAYVLCRRGTSLQGAGRFTESLPLLRQALEINPESLLATRLLAYGLSQSGSAAEAIRLYERAVVLDGTDLVLRLNLGMGLLGVGRFQQAVEHLTMATEREANLSDTTDTLVGLGAALVETGRVAEALLRFEQATALLPDHVDAQLNRAVCLSSLGDDDGAIAAYRTVISIAADRADAHYNLGTLLSRQGQREAAIVSLKQALALQPQMPGAHVNLGNALSSLGRPEEALEHFAQAADQAPDLFEARFNGAVLAARLGRTSQAEQWLREGLALAPGFSGVPLQLGRVLYNSGRFEEALERFRSAYELSPESIEAEGCLRAALAGSELPAP
ncbi:MAG: spermidine synthase [Pseudohongiellaceae bacterium]|jgi:spermidine synthase